MAISLAAEDHLSRRACGTRHVVAVVLRSSTAQAILEHLRLPSRAPHPRSSHLTAPAPLLVSRVRGSRRALP
jgi:hypothetical protein